MTKEDAVSIVEHQRKVLNLETLSVEALFGVNPVAVQGGQCHRVTVPLDDPTNENSAIITYFEIGLSHKDIKSELINEVVMQVL